MEYLHTNRTDPRHQTVLSHAPTFKGTVPEQRYAPSEVDLTPAIDTAKAFIGALSARQASQGNTRKDYIQKYKNTVLSDYAAQDMKLVLQAQQNDMDPSELALQRNLLKQQYLQVAPEYLTQADFNKQAKANFNLDVGAELYRNELEMAQHVRQKVYDQLQDNAKEYMKERYPNEYTSIDPSKYISMMMKDTETTNNLQQIIAKSTVLNSAPQTTEEERQARSRELGAAAEPVMESRMYNAIANAYSTIAEDGVIEDREVEEFTNVVANEFSANIQGLGMEDAQWHAKRIANRWLGNQNRAYNNRVAANLKSVEDRKKFITAQKDLMNELYAMKVQFGINIGDTYGPAQGLVFNRMSPGWLNKNGYDYAGILSSLFAGGTQAVLDQRKPEMENMFTPTGSGQYAAGLADLLNDPAFLKHIPEEEVGRYVEMSKQLAAGYSKLFADMQKLTPSELATYQFSWPQVMEATKNSLTLPTVSELAIDGNGEIEGTPEKKTINGRVWNYQHDINVKEGNYDSDAERVRQQEQYGLNTEAMLHAKLTSIKDMDGIPSLRYDPEAKQYYSIVPVDGNEYVNILNQAAFLSDINSLNKDLNQPNMVFTDTDGVTQIDMRDEVAGKLNSAYGVKEITKEEAAKQGERELNSGLVSKGMATTLTGIEETGQALEKKQYLEAVKGVGKTVLGAATAVVGGGIQSAYETAQAAVEAGEKLGENIPQRSLEKQYLTTVNKYAKDVDYLTQNYSKFNPTIEHNQISTRPFADNNGNVNTISIEDMDTGEEILIPTIVDGKQLSDQEAIDNYHKTNMHFGKYPTVKEANRVAKAIHNEGEVLLKLLELRKQNDTGYGNIPLPEVDMTEENSKIFRGDNEWVLGMNSDIQTAKTRYLENGVYVYKNKDRQQVQKVKEALLKAHDVYEKDRYIQPNLVAITKEQEDNAPLVIEVKGPSKKARSLKEEYIPGVL